MGLRIQIKSTFKVWVIKFCRGGQGRLEGAGLTMKAWSWRGMQDGSHRDALSRPPSKEACCPAVGLVNRQGPVLSSVKFCLSCRVSSQVAMPFLEHPASCNWGKWRHKALERCVWSETLTDSPGFRAPHHAHDLSGLHHNSSCSWAWSCFSPLPFIDVDP